jgi:hypothetical protein
VSGITITEETMKQERPIQVGDTVLYRHTVQFGDGPRNTGVVIALTPGGKYITMAEVEWRWIGLPSRLTVNHLTVIEEAVPAE